MNGRRFHSILAALALTAVAVAIRWIVPSPSPNPVSTLPASSATRTPAATDTATVGRVSPELASQWMAIEAREKQASETVWSAEAQADRCGQVFESFWDALNRSTNRFEVAARFPMDRILLPTWGPVQSASHGIHIFRPDGPVLELSQEDWQHRLHRLSDQGWTLFQSEFRHIRFQTNATGGPDRSGFHMTAHLLNDLTTNRASLSGELEVRWSQSTEPNRPPHAAELDARNLTLEVREGPPPFVPVLTESIQPPRHTLAVDPLIVHDLDGDGTAEILLVARNLIFRREPAGRYHSMPIAPSWPDVVSTAVLGDFDGDGIPDLLCQTLNGLEHLSGTSAGTFSGIRTLAWKAPTDVTYPMVLASGDVDLDGDLDVFLGQYKEPYEGGTSPTPYFAANDGNPAYLLLNDGTGRFRDVTLESGLSLNRRRRTYSASFADIDQDGRLDFLAVSDFAGLDLYRGIASGRFTEMTTRWTTQPHAFGMAHILSDFNSDGRPDLLMIGMNSPTADRLEHLGLRREDSHQDSRKRAEMTYGNRLYLGQPGGGFSGSAAGDTIARGGWAWGCAAADVDNDGFPDVAMVNGLETRETVRDYESEYWLHDQHVGTSEDNPAAYLYFKAKIARTRGHGQSYGGYEKNRLYLNERGQAFHEVGHLFGLALEQDSRNAVAEDVDGDGRMDLVITSFESWPNAKPTLRIFQNHLPNPGNWIGFRLPHEVQNGAWPGIQITVTTSNSIQTRVYTTGDSHRSQHSPSLHFGLGLATGPVSATIRWTDGKTLRRTDLESNRWHVLHRSAATPPASQP